MKISPQPTQRAILSEQFACTIRPLPKHSFVIFTLFCQKDRVLFSVPPDIEKVLGSWVTLTLLVSAPQKSV